MILGEKDDMQKIRRVALIGLGAMGATYGKFLHDYLGREGFSVIMDEARKEKYYREGLTVNGVSTDFRCAEAEETGLCDLVLVTVKYAQLSQAAAAIAPCVGEDTLILSLLNGISTERLLQVLYGEKRVPYAVTIANDLQRRGNVVTYQNTGRVAFGYQGRVTEKLLAIQELFRSSGIPCEATADIRRLQWMKFLINVNLNQIGAVLAATYGDFQQNFHLQKLLDLVGHEVISLANACGVDLNETDFQEFLRILNHLDSEGGTSMYQDMQAGRLTEVDIFAGEIMRLGAEKGMAIPYNTMLYHMVRALEIKKQAL